MQALCSHTVGVLLIWDPVAWVSAAASAPGQINTPLARTAPTQVLLGLHAQRRVYPALPQHLATLLAATLFHTSAHALTPGGWVGPFRYMLLQ